MEINMRDLTMQPEDEIVRESPSPDTLVLHSPKERNQLIKFTQTPPFESELKQKLSKMQIRLKLTDIHTREENEKMQFYNYHYSTHTHTHTNAHKLKEKRSILRKKQCDIGKIVRNSTFKGKNI